VDKIVLIVFLRQIYAVNLQYIFYILMHYYI